jgi:exoribonuclease-2
LGLAANLRLQDDVARKLRALRQENGALELDTTESRLVFADGRLSALEVTRSNRAKELIEDFMITVNGAVARFLAAQGFPAVRRVVHTPRRWDRIVELAAGRGHRLPATPDSRALDHFLAAARAADPPGFPELSLAVIKLLGPGEYTAEVPAPGTGGHFGLAVKDYTHSTAPNRRYPDLVTQRLVKAALGGQGPPYAPGELVALSTHCTRAQDAARKVERQVAKSAAAMLMDDHIGKRFDALVTGAAPKGSWVKLLDPPVEGRLVRGEAGVDVGDRVVVQLLETDVERGFIDFGRVS